MPNLIAVVDDDIAVRESLESLLRSAGLSVIVFASGEAFLKSSYLSRTDCIILDVRMPGMSGFELQRHLVNSGIKTPVIFMTAHGYDERARSEVFSGSTVACLTKPLSEDELLDAIRSALKLNPNGTKGGCHE